MQPASSERACAIHIPFIKEIKKPFSSSIVEFYKYAGIFKNTREVPDEHTLARASPHFSRVLKNSRVLIPLKNALHAFFISLLDLSRGTNKILIRCC